MERTRFYSDELEKGIELLFFQPDTGRYEEAAALIQTACDRGEPDAFYVMLCYYIWGDESLQKYRSRYLDYVKKGIQAGSELCALGASENGLALDVREVLLHSPQISVRKVKEMAFAGNVLAQYALGSFYLGNGVERYVNNAYYFTYDYSEKDNPDFRIHLRVNNGHEGLKWVLRAAKWGCLPAFEKAYEVFLSGAMLYEKLVIDRDIKRAAAYVEEFQITYKLRGDFCARVGDGYQADGNMQKVQEWLQRGVDAGSLKCIDRLADLYYEGAEGVEPDREKAFQLYLRSAEQGSSAGQFRVGEYYFHGILGEEDKEKAFSWYLKAADGEHSVAQYYVASYYRYGWGNVEQDCKACLRYAQRAVQNGCIAAKAFVGEGYLYADKLQNGFVKNPQVGIRTLQECVEQDNTDLGGKALALKLLEEAGQKG